MRASTHSKQYGITLVELMITIAILAIVAMIAIPSFQSIMANLEAKRTTSTLSTTIRDSKHIAYTYRQRIGICGSIDNQLCDNTGWSTGLLIFHDVNFNRLREPTEKLIKLQQLNLKYGSLRWQGTGHTNAILFQPDTGLPRGSNGSFYYCSSINLNYRIFLSNMGHSRIEKLISC